MIQAQYARFFTDDAAEARASVLENYRQIVEWAASAYYSKFLVWLEEEANRPIPVTENHMEMVKAAVRANTFREIRRHLQRTVSEASAGLQAAREDIDGRQV